MRRGPSELPFQAGRGAVNGPCGLVGTSTAATLKAFAAPLVLCPRVRPLGGGVRLTGFFGLTLSGLFFRRGLGDDSLRLSDSGGSDGSLFTQTAAACVAGSLGDDQGHARVMQGCVSAT